MKQSEIKLIAQEVVKAMKESGCIEDKILTIGDVAEILGCSELTIRKRIKEIPHTKFGKKYLFFRSDIFKYLKR